eukprot:scaffold25881_cov129-Isochrysis_galbana.AAC.7
MIITTLLCEGAAEDSQQAFGRSTRSALAVQPASARPEGPPHLARAICAEIDRHLLLVDPVVEAAGGARRRDCGAGPQAAEYQEREPRALGRHAWPWPSAGTSRLFGVAAGRVIKPTRSRNRKCSFLARPLGVLFLGAALPCVSAPLAGRRPSTEHEHGDWLPGVVQQRGSQQDWAPGACRLRPVGE